MSVVQILDGQETIERAEGGKAMTATCTEIELKVWDLNPG